MGTTVSTLALLTAQRLRLATLDSVGNRDPESLSSLNIDKDATLFRVSEQ